ncbi:hypothetical protein ASF12_07475 [Paenibacillus sp. Leaf72]|nr:hypothetical protein ASF12_07475 [Paenibacillus sp. Leaf72]
MNQKGTKWLLLLPLTLHKHKQGRKSNSNEWLPALFYFICSSAQARCRSFPLAEAAAELLLAAPMRASVVQWQIRKQLVNL